jgi:hypothetical protein
MKTVYAGLAAMVLAVAVPGPKPAQAMPFQSNLAIAAAGAVTGPTEVQYRRYYRGYRYGYRRGGWAPRYRYYGYGYPYRYYGYGYPYRYYGYGYPYRYYAPGPYVRLGPFAFGFGGW